MTKPIIDNLTLPIGSCTLERTESGAQVLLENEKAFSITFPESFILQKLAEDEGEVVTKHDLIVAAWGRPEIIGANSLPVAITNLRKILELSSIRITNIPRKGYKIDIPVPSENREETITEREEKAPKDTITHPPDYQVITADTLSKFKLYVSCFILAFITYIIVYVAFSWVKVDCFTSDQISVCSIKGEQPDALILEGKSGQFYFSEQSGLIEVNRYVG